MKPIIPPQLNLLLCGVVKEGQKTISLFIRSFNVYRNFQINRLILVNWGVNSV